MQFAEKLWLIAAVFALPLLALLFYESEKNKKRCLAVFAASKLLVDLAASFSPRKRNLKLVLSLTGIAMILLSLARPQWGYEWQETKGRGIDILIALDTSRSMLARDIRPNRLERAKLAIQDLMVKAKGDRLGLIAFAGRAFLQCPLTLDHSAFLQTLESIDTNIISQGGTNIAAAIAEAQASFGEGDNFKILLLITDGEDLEAEGIRQAREAAEEGVKIYTVGVGSTTGELIPISTEDGSGDFLRDEKGDLVKTRLDEPTLSKIATTTDGFYTLMGSTGSGLDRVYETGLAAIPKQEREARLHRVPNEQFQWPLGLALLAILIEFLLTTRRRRREPRARRLRWIAGGTLAAVLTGITPTPVEGSPQSAKEAYDAGNFEDARDEYREALERRPEDVRLHYNLGSTHYRSGQFNEAEATYLRALKTEDLELQKNAFYNLGNTHYRLGEALLSSDSNKTIAAWEEGLKDYQNTLNLAPEDEDAKFNHALLEQRLEALKQQLRQQQKEQEQSQQQDEQGENRADNGASQSSDDQEKAEQARNEQGEDAEHAKELVEKAQSPTPSQPTGEGDENPSDEAPPPLIAGRMTREEARQMLDALKDSEKKLPAVIIVPENTAGRPSRGRDW